MAKVSVYHICRRKDRMDFSKGYIGKGIFEDRVYRHRRGDSNPHLTNAYTKYSDIIEYVLCFTSEENAFYIENSLRPSPNIGWNISSGGRGGLRNSTPWNKGKKMLKSKTDKWRESYQKNWRWEFITPSGTFRTTKEAAMASGVAHRTITRWFADPRKINYTKLDTTNRR